MGFGPGGVSCWVRPKVLPEGLNQVSDGGSDSIALKGFFACGSKGVASDTVCEACDDEGALVLVEGVHKWVILQSASLEVFLEIPKSPSMLGAGLGGCCSLRGSDSSSDTIHEVSSAGSGLI